MSTDILMTKAGPGAGDMLSALNSACAWAAHYNTDVELEFHWNVPEDYLYHPKDKEKVGERATMILEDLKDSHRVNLVHVWDSTLFDYHNSDHNSKLRRLINPIRWIVPSVYSKDELHIGSSSGNDKLVPFSLFFGGAEWDFKESPPEEPKKKIVVWSWELNREPPQEMKMFPMDWGTFIRSDLLLMFPGYQIVELTYRDSYRKAYSEIKDCSFCVGYDGMWHLIPRNFGKLFVSITGNNTHSIKHTNPSSASFVFPGQFYGFLNDMANSPDVMKKELSYAKSFHKKRMEWYGNLKG